jgi:hypothetical protein
MALKILGLDETFINFVSVQFSGIRSGSQGGKHSATLLFYPADATTRKVL